MGGKSSQNVSLTIHHHLVLKAECVYSFTSTAPVCHEDMLPEVTGLTATFT